MCGYQLRYSATCAPQCEHVVARCAGLLINLLKNDVSAMRVGFGATVTLMNTTFLYNDIYKGYSHSATLSIRGEHPFKDTIVIMKQFKFSGNSPEYEVVTVQGDDFLVNHYARIFTDDMIPVLNISDNGAAETSVFSETLDAVPAGREGISLTSAWLQGVKKVRLPVPRPCRLPIQ
jgi:hypothetical protein